MNKRRRWSKEEDSVLLDQITRHEQNLQEAFKQTAILLNRTQSSCSQHWYVVLSKSTTSSKTVQVKKMSCVNYWQKICKFIKKLLKGD